MNRLTDMLKQMEAELDGYLKTVAFSREQLKAVPDLKLRISHRNGKPAYYLCGEKPGSRRYLHIGQEELAKKVAQKEYDRQIEMLVKKALRDVRLCLRHGGNEEIRQVFERMNPSRKVLIEPVILPDERYVSEWEAEDYRRRAFADEAAEIYSERGERVRSKSEKILADKLASMKIPYKYERPLKLRGSGVIHPDFTVLNVRQRREFYLEHFGMMDDPKYSENAVRRIEDYERNGIFPGERLLMTFETRNSPLNTRLVDALFQQYLI